MDSYTWILLACFLSLVFIIIGVYTSRAAVAITVSILSLCCIIFAGAIWINKIDREDHLNQQNNRRSTNDWPDF